MVLCFCARRLTPTRNSPVSPLNNIKFTRKQNNYFFMTPFFLYYHSSVGHKKCIEIGDQHCYHHGISRESENVYLRKTKASPATSRFDVTKVLHPVVSRCLRGWPKKSHHNSLLLLCCTLTLRSLWNYHKYRYLYRCVWISIHNHANPSQQVPESESVVTCPKKGIYIFKRRNQKPGNKGNKRPLSAKRRNKGQLTSGGRHSVACRLRTENPPWVLVSEAVRILQNECTVGRTVSGCGWSRLTGSFCCSTRIKSNLHHSKFQDWIRL